MGGGDIFVVYVAEENHKIFYLQMMAKPRTLLPVHVMKELQGANVAQFCYSRCKKHKESLPDPN